MVLKWQLHMPRNSLCIFVCLFVLKKGIVPSSYQEKVTHFKDCLLYQWSIDYINMSILCLTYPYLISMIAVFFDTKNTTH